jgi:hypothetical protein
MQGFDNTERITERYKQLVDITDKLGDDKKAVIAPLITEIVFMESKLESLRELPHLRMHPKNPERQQITPAGKQYKETMQAYLNAVKVVMSALYKTDTSAADELLEKLKEFEL